MQGFRDVRHGAFTPGMNDGHTLHEAHVEGSVEPAGAFAVEERPGPDGIGVVALAGELDIAATASVRERVDAAVGGRGLVLDLAGATFLDSSMLKELLRANVELRERGGELVLAAPQGAVTRLLELTRTSELFTVVADRDAAFG